MGIEIRKELTATRTKLRIVQKKIRKYGDMGKIPMGASMRVYEENSDSDSDSSSSTEEEEDISNSSFGSDGAFERLKKKREEKRKKKPLLESGLVY